MRTFRAEMTRMTAALPPQPIVAVGHRIALVLAAVLWAMPLSGRAEPSRISWAGGIDVAQGKAVRGPWQMNESVWHFVDDPSPAITENGHVGVAWVDHARQDVLFQVYGPDDRPRFPEPVNVSRSPGIFSWLPRVIMSSDEPEQVFVLWQEIIFSGGTHGGEILFARSTDGGRTFGKPLNLSNTIAGAGKGRLTESIWFNGSLGIARGPEGNLYAAWTEYEGALRFSRSTDSGENFSEPVLIAGGKGELPARGPSLAVDPGGAVHLVWTVGEVVDADIRYVVSSDQGRSFGGVRTLFPSEGYSDAPKIAAGRDGTLHLAYGESPEGPLQRYHVRYARTDGGSFGKSVEISTEHEKVVDGAGFPSLSLDAEGNVYVLWEIFHEGEFHPRGLGFTFSGDGGRAFDSPVVVPGSLEPRLGINGSQQGLFMNKLAVNGSGEIAIVNSTFIPGESSHIRLFRGRRGTGG
jgi:hypothetical protein